MRSFWTGLLLSLALVAAGCDGGARGSGITTAEGNVSSADATARRETTADRSQRLLARWTIIWPFARRAEADSAVEGIRVSLESAGIETRTDVDGRFRLRGPFGGVEALRFEAPDGGEAALEINVPLGGTLTLADVRLDYERGQASVARQTVVFDGRILAVDCGAETLTLESREVDDDGDTYALDLRDSTLQTRGGETLACADLRAGDAVHVEGTVDEDGTYGGATVVVER